MATLTSGFVEIPTQKIDPWLGKIKSGSVVAALSPSTPQKFGAGKAMTFNIGEAEYVGEGGNKGPSTVTKGSQTVDPFKFHKTLRFNEEVRPRSYLILLVIGFIRRRLLRLFGLVLRRSVPSLVFRLMLGSGARGRLRWGWIRTGSTRLLLVALF